MSKIKEKKLNAIKLEMDEIKKFIETSNYSEISEQNISNSLNKNNSNLDDTLTLTKVVKKEDKYINNNSLDKIERELIELKSVIDNNTNLLKEILFKIK